MTFFAFLGALSLSVLAFELLSGFPKCVQHIWRQSIDQPKPPLPLHDVRPGKPC